MNSQLSEIESNTHTSNKRRTLGVIVLTDNRIKEKEEKLRNHYHDQNADLKETQYDPPNLQHNQTCLSNEENYIVQLSKRVFDLQQRIKLLQNCSGLSSIVEDQTQPRAKKKNRRTFKQLHRNHKCVECGKIYGSFTSLKCHLKLKHSSNNENGVYVS